MPTTLTPTLAPELWLAIAAELASTSEDGRLPRQYMAIHRSFLTLYLDAEYREVQWTKPSNGMMRQLEQIESHPSIASRVRRFELSTWFLLNRNQVQLTMLQEVYYTTLLHLSTYSPCSAPRTELEATSKLLLDRVILAMYSMRNVVDFRIEPRGLSVMDFRHLLGASREAFGRNLCRLSIRASVLKCSSVLSLGHLDRLQQLELNFDQEVVTEVGSHLLEEAEAKTLRRKIIPFLNHHRYSLRSLSLVSRSAVDLSPLFRSIGPFPHLRRFSADICFTKEQLSDQETLVQFIRAHQPSLAHLGLQPRAPMENLLTEQDAAAQHLQMWVPFQQALLKHRDIGMKRCSLRSLCTPVGDFDLCLELISRFTHSLSHLSLTDLRLDWRQREQLKTAFRKEVTLLTRLDEKRSDSWRSLGYLQVRVLSDSRSSR